MNPSFKACAVVTLWAVLVAGCKEAGRDRPVELPRDTRPEATEPAAPSPEPAEPDTTPPATEPEAPPPDKPEETPAATAAKPPALEDVVEDLDEALKEIAELERDTEYFAALTRVRKLQKIYRGREEAKELNILHQRLHRDYRTSSGLDFAVDKLGSDSNVAVSVATGKLLDAGEVGLVFLRKAVREAEPKVAVRAADILMQQGDPQITQLIVERMEQEPPAPLGDELGKLLQRLDEIEPEWIDRLCALAKRESSGQAGAVEVLIDRLERSVRTQLEPAKPEDTEPKTKPEAAEKDEPKPEPPIKVDQRLVRTLYEVAETAEGPVQRQAVEALLLVLDKVNRRDGEALNQLLGNDEAYGFVGDYVVACLGSDEVEDRVWAIARAESFGMKTPGLWAQVRPEQPEQPEQPGQPDGRPVLDERLDPVLSFGNLAALGQTGPVKQGQTIRWNGFVDVPSEGKYTFSVDCDEKSPATLYVDGKQTAADEPVELSAGWHDVQAKMDLSGDEARLAVSWAGPGLEKQGIPAERLACADRTRMLIWRLGRPCDLAQARNLAGQLLHSRERVDKELAAKLTALAAADRPARPAVAAVLAEVLDNSMASSQEPPEWEAPALRTLLAASKEIEGPEQRRVVASLVNHFVRRAGGKIEEFSRQAESPGAYGYVRASIAERLDAEDPEVARWAMEQAGAFQLALQGLWAKTYAKQEPAEGDAPLDQRLSASLNFADRAAMQLGLAKRIVWNGYLNVPAEGAYTFAIDSPKQAAMQLDGGAVELGKPTELHPGLHPVVVEWNLADGAPKLVLSWQPPDKQALEVIPPDRLICPDWPKVLIWEMVEKPPQAEAIAGRLALMIDRIDQPLAEELLALVQPDGTSDSPAAMPAAEVLARVLRDGRLDDEFEKKIAERLWPLVAKTDGPRQRAIAGSLVTLLGRLFASKGEEFDKALKAEGASQTLRDFVAARLDAEEPDVAAWAMEHAGPVGLGLRGLWFERCDSPEGPSLSEHHRDGELNLADLNAVKGTVNAKEGEAIRCTGYLRCPSDGAYVFTIDAAKGSPAEIKVGGQAIQSGKPIELTAGTHPLDVRLKIGPDAKLVFNWQPPGVEKAASITQDSYACPAWPKVLLWQLQQKPDVERSEEIASHLARMVDQIDQSLAEDLLALVQPDSPASTPAADVLARVLHDGRLDDGFEKKIAEQLWPLVAQTKDARQRVIAGSLVTALHRLYANKGEEFDKAMKAKGASQTLRDFIAERLDAEDPAVRLWAAEHAEPFSLLSSGLEGSFFGADFKARLFDRVNTKMQIEPGQFGYPDKRNDNMGIRWSGLIRVPADGEYIFSSVVDDTCRLWLDGRPVIEDSKKPATVTLTAGLHEIRIEYVETTGAERLVVYWQVPGQNERQVLAGELKHVDSVKLLLHKLAGRPNDPQATAWLQELSYKADRLTAEPIEVLSKLATKRASWQGPLAVVAAEAILRNPGKAPAPAAPLLAKSVAALKDDARRQAVEALVACFSAACGGDKAKFQQAAGSDKTYDFLREEVQSAADSTDTADTEWAQAQAKFLGLKLSTLVRQGKDGRVVLTAKAATRHGKSIKYESGQDKDNIGSWSSAEDFVSWRLAVETGGTFNVSLSYSCPNDKEGSEFVIATGGRKLPGKVTATGDWNKYQTMDLGNIKLDAGIHQLTVKPKTIPKGGLMNLKSVTLELRR